MITRLLNYSAVTLGLWLTLPIASPARILVVSPDGDNQSDGNTEHPFRSIDHAAHLAQPGDTILVKAGVYRERVAPPRGGEPGKPITYRGEKLGTVFIRGSEAWTPKWQRHQGAVFFAAPEENLFRSDDVYVDDANPFRVALSSTPYNRQGKQEAERFGKGDQDLIFTCGQIMVNGTPWEQRPFLKEVESRPGTWYFAPDSGRVYINFGELDPAAQRIELSTRRRIFAPHTRGLGHIIVEGFVMEHCGNQYPTNFWKERKWAQAGAMGLRGGHHWIVRNNLIRYVGADALDVGCRGGDNERASRVIADAPLGHDNLIEQNYIVDNGAGGVIGSTTTRMIIRENVILRNNRQGFIGMKRFEHAGIKGHGMRDGLIERNYVADNRRAEGIWLDNQFPGTRVTRNVIVNNGARGIFLEMSDYTFDTALIDHNISIGNGDAQFYVHDASGSAVMHNLFANSPAEAKYGQGVLIHQVTTRTATGYHSIYNNLFVSHKVMLDINYPAHRSGPQRLDHNVYDATPHERSFLINSASDIPSPWEPEEFLALVQKDIGAGKPQAVNDGKKIALTLDEWRTFWSAHGQTNDLHSVTREGMQVSYDPQTFELNITLPFDPAAIGSTLQTKMDRDFEGTAMPQDGTALPGPLQTLHRGENTFTVWDGLPLLDEGELPR